MSDALSHITECPVCLIRYVNPQLLPCQHSLCAQCVSQIQRGATIKCAMCNTTHDVTKVQNDFRMAQIIDALDGDMTSPIDGEAPEAPEAPRDAVCESACNPCPKSIARIVNVQLQSIARIDAAIKQLEVTQTNALQESDELRQKSLNDVNKHFDSLNARMSDFIKTQISRLENTKSELTEQVQEINRKRDTLERLVRESAAESAVKGASLPQDVTRRNAVISDDDLYIENVDIRVIQDGAWNASAAASLQLNRSALKDDPVVFGSDVKTSLNCLCVRKEQFIRQNETELVGRFNALRLINQELWSCQAGGHVQIHDLRLENLRTLSNTDWGTVYDVTEMIDGHVVLACRKGLFHVTKAGETVTKIDSLTSFSVVQLLNKLYAYANGPPRLVIYACSDGNNTWYVFNTMRLHTLCGHAYVTLRVTNSAIYACSVNDNKIVKVSLTGKKLQTLGSKGSRAGQFDRPYLCQADDEDSLLVADRYNNRLQVISSLGEATVLRLKPCVIRPLCAVYADNRLYVAAPADSHLLLYVQETGASPSCAHPTKRRRLDI